MAKAAAQTGPGPTAMVAVEQYFPKDQRLIDDDLAYGILPFVARAYVWLMRIDWLRDWMIRMTERSVPGVWAGISCRKRYIDEKVTESSGRVDAMVNLGAGSDTRAYRLDALAEIPVWEIDQIENIEPKKKRLERLFGTVPAHVSLVPIDFDREDLKSVLKSNDYSVDRRTFFVWEAVTQYLTEDGVKSTFDFLSAAARGSLLTFTYIRKDFLEGRVLFGLDNLFKKYVERDKVWLFGIDPEDVAATLESYGWRVVEHLGYHDLAERYVKPTGRNLTAMPIERVVYAEKV